MSKNSQIRRSILKELYFAKALSCAELGVKIDKSFPVTLKFILELIEDGVVVDPHERCVAILELCFDQDAAVLEVPHHVVVDE